MRDAKIRRSVIGPADRLRCCPFGFHQSSFYRSASINPRSVSENGIDLRATGSNRIAVETEFAEQTAPLKIAQPSVSVERVILSGRIPTRSLAGKVISFR